MNGIETELFIKNELPKGLMISSVIAIFFVLALIPFIAWLLEYKDTISAPLMITTEVTPVDIYARTSGMLVLKVADQDPISQGQILAYIQNTANFNHVDTLLKKVSQPSKTSVSIAKDLCNLGNLRIGTLKPDLVKVTKAAEDYQAFLSTDQHQSLIASNLQEIDLYNKRKKILEQKESAR